jgi:hypothetical protein
MLKARISAAKVGLLAVFLWDYQPYQRSLTAGALAWGYWKLLQRELARDEEQCRRQCETQDRVGDAHPHIAADHDPRQRTGEQ